MAGHDIGDRARERAKHERGRQEFEIMRDEAREVLTGFQDELNRVLEQANAFFFTDGPAERPVKKDERLAILYKLKLLADSELLAPEKKNALQSFLEHLLRFEQDGRFTQ